MNAFVRNLLVALAGGLFCIACVFSSLEDDLEMLDEVAHLYAGDIAMQESRQRALVVVAMRDANGEDIRSFRMLGSPGRFEIRSERMPLRFFGFIDLNRDLTFQSHEPYAWAGDGRVFDPARESTEDIQINIGDLPGKQLSAPHKIVDEPLENHLNNYFKIALGEITPLDSPLFAPARAEQGLWTPFAFVEQGGTGLHFLEPYDPQRIPVLFVHGINASPRDFATLIEQLDKTRYQAWVLNYPSGLRLSWVARGLYQFMEVMHRQHGFKELHIVAHSMGGLVSRGALNICAQNLTCDYLSSYTTVSTPWNGVDSAANGVRWAPTAVPVWHDLDPSSEYVTTLFDTALPAGLPYQLIFGYRRDSVFGAESNDGVVALTSQLRLDAQRDAETVRGFDEGHVSILENRTVISRVFEHLSSGS